MSEPIIYCDYNATHPVLPEVAKCLREVLSEYGNPSSPHAMGRRARDLVEDTRERIADHLRVSHKEIFFTSGGTESNHLAIRGIKQSLSTDQNKARVIYSPVEHSSLLGAIHLAEKEGLQSCRLRVDENGIPDFEQLCQELPVATMVSLMHANNETGVQMPMELVVAEAKRWGVVVHSDCVQQFGKGNINLEGIDLASFSAHKIGGSKGLGFIYKSTAVELEPLIMGGSQERELRPGTENLWGIYSLREALKHLCSDAQLSEIQSLRNYFEHRLENELEGIRINGRRVSRLGNTSNVTFFKCSGESLLLSLDLKGFCVSLGSACASGSVTPSHVLLEMGMSESEAKSSIRFSFGRFNTKAEVDALVEELKNSCARLRKSNA